LGRHASASLQSVGDLRGLWNAVAATAKFRVTPPAALLALPASRAELEKKQAAQANQGVHFGGMTTEYHYGGAGAPATPGAAVAQHQLVQAIGGLLNAGGMFVGE
jgi:hypothetical protein